MILERHREGSHHLRVDLLLGDQAASRLQEPLIVIPGIAVVHDCFLENRVFHFPDPLFQRGAAAETYLVPHFVEAYTVVAAIRILHPLDAYVRNQALDGEGNLRQPEIHSRVAKIEGLSTYDAKRGSKQLHDT